MLQALALRYRPRNFDELIGQESVSRSLSHALDENRLTHAYLFSGLRGSGKTSSARIFSKALVCEQGPTARPCEKCAHCMMANESRHIDIIEMDAASHRKIDDVRELIEQTKYAPAAARFKIFIIDEVHMLTREAFNALLKTLEEPPPYVKFILATTDPLKLPATVLSRTQHFRFKQISKQNIIKHLEFILSKEGVQYESEALDIIARSGSGSLRDTLTLLDQAIVYSNGRISKEIAARMLGLLDPSKIEEILQIIMNTDRDAARAVIAELEEYEAEMIIDELIANLKENFLAGNSKYSLLLYERFFRILAQVRGMLNVSSDNGFVLGIMIFMMMEAVNLKSIDEMIAQVGSESINLSSNLDMNATLTHSNLASKSALNLNARSASSGSNSSYGATQDTISSRTLAQSSPYDMFLVKIYDRDYELGECFKECVEFLDFSDGCLNLASSAAGANQDKLRSNSKVIMEILRLVFGSDAKIKISPKETQSIGARDTGDEQNLSAQEMMSKNLSKNPEPLNDELSPSAQQNLQSNEPSVTPAKAKQESDGAAKNLDVSNAPGVAADTQGLNLACDEYGGKFSPNYEDMRDDSEDFVTAYAQKFKTDETLAVDEFAALDMELERINSQGKSSQDENLISSNLQEFSGENEKLEPSAGELEQDLSTKDEANSGLNLTPPKDEKIVQDSKNLAVLKEANRLFGEPQILDLN